jgi:hypothetical protein
MNDPTTPAEWQEAADAAYFMLAVESARLYGLIEGGPEVNVERCDEILKEAAMRGITPRPIDEMDVEF